MSHEWDVLAVPDNVIETIHVLPARTAVESVDAQTGERVEVIGRVVAATAAEAHVLALFQHA